MLLKRTPSERIGNLGLLMTKTTDFLFFHVYLTYGSTMSYIMGCFPLLALFLGTLAVAQQPTMLRRNRQLASKYHSSILSNFEN